MLGAGAVVFGLVDLAIFLYPVLWVSPWPAAVGMVLVGLPGAVTVAGYQTLLQRHTRDAERGRVMSFEMLAMSVSVVVGSLAAGLPRRGDRDHAGARGAGRRVRRWPGC